MSQDVSMCLCDICADDNAQDVSQCPSCAAKSCRTCLQTFILSRKENPKCFKCKLPYSDVFLAGATTKQFRLKNLRNHMKEIIWDREKGLLPSSQRAATLALYQKRMLLFNQYEDTCKNVDSETDDSLSTMLKQYRTLLEIAKSQQKFPSHDPSYILLAAKANKIRQLLDIHSSKQLHTVKDFMSSDEIDLTPIDVSKVSSHIKDLLHNRAHFYDQIIHTDSNKLRQDLLVAAIENTDNEVHTLAQDSASALASQKFSLARPCPSSSCRGFCDRFGKCGICNSRICIRCWIELPKGMKNDDNQVENKTDDAKSRHVCKEEDLKTKEVILSDSKPCPTCRTFISRVSGCDHMWCPSCKSGFNWRTGNSIHNKVNTNPMVHQWLRSQNRDDNNNTNDRRCPTNPYEMCINSLETLLLYKVFNAGNKLQEYKKYIEAVENVVRVFRLKMHRAERLSTMDIEQLNADLRVRYLINEIDEKAFKTLSLTAVRRTTASHDLSQLYEMLFTALHSITQDLIKEMNLNKDARKVWTQYLTERSHPFEFAMLISLLDTFKITTEKLRVYFNQCLVSLAQQHYAKLNIAYYSHNVINDRWGVHGHSSDL